MIKEDIPLNIENNETKILNYILVPISILIHEWKIMLAKKKWCYVQNSVFKYLFDVGI